MGIYFGTDGFRGIYGEIISPEIAYKVGNSLARLCNKRKVLIGRDTRQSGSILSLSVASGLMSYGINVVDVGIVPTPAVAYLTKKLNFDYGVVISASHNPKEFNGIKIFDCEGYKISESLENEIERNLLYSLEKPNEKLGQYKYCPKLKKHYKENLLSAACPLKGLKIALDLANGASYEIGKELFEKLGAKVYATSTGHNGKKINVDCGALHPQVISNLVKKYDCDMGFAFDGDADRIIACDENGKILDGDDILFLLSQKVPTNQIVGTSMTNKGLEMALSFQGKSLLRADVGDKYVCSLMRQSKSLLGGEPSGHIINFLHSTTGDGVLTALTIASIIKENAKPLSSLLTFYHYPQCIINIPVVDKYRILNSDLLSSETLKIQHLLSSQGRLLVRASGTENKIRVMCEHIEKEKADEYANIIANIVKEIDNIKKDEL